MRSLKSLVVAQPSSGASPTVAPTAIDVDVFRRERVAPDAVRLSRPVGPRAGSTHVFGVRYRFQVVRSDTQLVAAQMVDLQPFGDRPVSQFVTEPVRVNRLALDENAAIAGNRFGTCPHPALTRLIYPRPEASKTLAP